MGHSCRGAQSALGGMIPHAGQLQNASGSEGAERPPGEKGKEHFAWTELFTLWSKTNQGLPQALGALHF